jgi:1-acyl-sn-glycerol-3-phosphate acyltransferase
LSDSIRFVARKLLPLIADIEIHGESVTHFPQSGFVLAANHLGRLDSMMVYYVLDTDDVIHPLADKYKKSLVFRLAARWLKMTWLKRGEVDMKAMREFISRLKNGGVMVITPEGTRSKTATLLKGESGAIYIASSAGVPIVPVAVTGTEDALVKSRLKKFQRLKITLTAGNPYIPPDLKAVRGTQRDELLQTATDDLMCRIAAMLPESYRGVYADHPRLKELLAGQPT